MDILNKKLLFEAMLAKGVVAVEVNPKADGVLLPKHLANEKHVMLGYDLNFPIPIPDLEVRDDGITATLSFNQTPGKTFAPWTSIYGISNEDIAVFYRKEAVALSSEDRPSEQSPSGPPKLKLVP